MDESKIVTLRTFDSEQEATLAQGLLESAGIGCSLLHEDIHNVLPLTSTPIELVVAAADEQRALDILAAKFDKEEFKAATATAGKARRACKCSLKRK